MAILRTLIISFLVATLPLTNAFAANANVLSTPRTQTSLISEVKAIHAGEKFWVALHIQLQPGWHSYWVNPGDSGITPQLKWTLPNGFIAGPTQYLAPGRERIGPLVDYAYDNDAYYLVAVVPPSALRTGMTSILALKASWLVCKDICVPESGDLSLSLPAGEKAEPSEDAQQMGELVNKLPMPVSDAITFHKVDKEIRFDVPLHSMDIIATQLKNALFFPESQELIANAAEQKVRIGENAISFAIGQAEGKIADNASGVISLYLTSGARRDYAFNMMSENGAAQVAAVENMPSLSSVPQSQGEHITPLEALWYAFIGGLVLNAMPCVFPVLSLKCLAVAKKASAEPHQARKHGIAYTIGVILSFLLLAFALVAFQKSGQAVGWGYQMQSPVFVALLSLLLFTVGLNLAGYFDLPLLFGNTGNEAASQDNVRGSFLTGVLAVMVATPCTAPFMASAIGFALTQGSGVIFSVFGALGLGLASPFLVISFYPRLIRALPKPGAWMIVFKELLSFPMFGWTVWLLWVLAREAGADAACVVILGMILITFGFWLWRRESGFWKFFAIVSSAAGVATAVMAAHMPMPQSVGPVRTHADSFTPAKLEALRKDGKAVFIDATADWCLICKVNENVALSSPEVLHAFKEKQVAYLVADWTYGDGDITRYLESFGRSGVPIYVYYPPHSGAPVVLPQILTPATVLEVLQ